MVRNVRDNAWLNVATGGWTQFLATDVASCVSPASCNIDPKTLTVSLCADASGCELYYDYTSQGDGFYTYSGSTPSVFKRKITVTDIGQSSGDSEVNVSSVVSWTQGKAIYNATYSENLLDWNQ